MTLQEAIYDRLSNDTTLAAIIDTRLFPDVPSVNTQIPFAVYWTTGSEPQVSLSTTAPTLTKYTVQVECWARTLAEITGIQSAVRASLHYYQGGAISRAFLSSEDTSPEDEGYHGQQSYTVWYANANVVSTPGSTATITTANDTITMTAGTNVLTLTSGGLFLNGVEVGSGGGGTGEDGKSAYELAVEGGFVGDIETWLESLQGQEGPQGETGPAGTIPIAGSSPGDNVLWWNDASEGTNMGLVYTTPGGVNVYLYD